jgi:catechol 2,3-dioxygenase-like lactoylglutathione lyase family enzyme
MVRIATMFGSNDIEKAKAFYDQVLSTIGVTGLFEHGSGGRIYGANGVPLLSIVRPFNGSTATAGNGTMGSLMVDSKDQVDAIHAKALELGGTCDGPPGPRTGGGTTAYACYFRDLDGNKICAISF